jgi:hypothetical protein
MKPINKYLFFLLLFITISIAASFSPIKNNKENDAAIEHAINSKSYVFKARTATPLSGGLIQLNGSNYDLTILPKAIKCDLPFFGRAYRVTYGGEGGIKFSSDDFHYTVKKKNKRGWSIIIKPNDNQDVRLLRLDISKSGYAALSVISTNRQQISFDGNIEAGK